MENHKIQILNDHVINKIAAGEVVERPASVVKELVENSIDAGATSIHIRLKDGGVSQILVTDNGEGMNAEDAKLCVMRHATSKLRNAEDLFALESMGFRGEALAAVASISKFKLTTNQRKDGVGSKVDLDEESHVSVVEWNGPPGTSVYVEDLFYNCPGRLKFLKSKSTEFTWCHELIKAYALCYPKIAFKLTHQDKTILSVEPVRSTEPATAETSLRSRCEAILGSEIAQQMAYISESNQIGSIHALISPPGYEKNFAKFLYCFVNGRWIKDRIVKFAILRGYHSHLPKGKYPVVVAFIDCPPSLVDVNVHPTKSEVKFQYASDIQGLISLAVTKALRSAWWCQFGHENAQSTRLEPSKNLESSFSTYQTSAVHPPHTTYRGSSLTRATVSSQGSHRGSKTFTDQFAKPISAWSKRAVDTNISLRKDLTGAQSDEPTPSIETPAIPWADLNYIGCFSKCYLLFESQKGMLSIDQHAFHERILFERLSKNREQILIKQNLLIPHFIEFDPLSLEKISELQEALVEAKFGFKLLKNGIEVLGVPSLLTERNLDKVFGEFAECETPNDAKGVSEALLNHILSTIACHSAVRAGEELPDADLKHLLSEAETVDFFHNCPHGRRVFKWWTLRDVEKWFDR